MVIHLVQAEIILSPAQVPQTVQHDVIHVHITPLQLHVTRTCNTCITCILEPACTGLLCTRSPWQPSPRPRPLCHRRPLHQTPHQARQPKVMWYHQEKCRGVGCREGEGSLLQLHTVIVYMYVSWALSKERAHHPPHPGLFCR